jgi:lipopolysaccharide assembly protein A
MTSSGDAERPAQPVSNPGTAPAAPGRPSPAPAPVSSPAQASVQEPVARVRHHALHRTRAGGLWVGLALAAIVLLLLLVFILENGQRADIGYFGAHGHLPLGIALLLAAVAGALLVTIPGTARIMQLRRTARRHRAVDAAASAGPPQETPVTGDAGPGR